MKKAKNIIKKLLTVMIILIFNALIFLNSVYATTITSADVYSTGDCGQLLKYKGVVVKVSYIEYNNNGQTYPAYCLDKTKPGAEHGQYTVSVQGAINDVGLWRIIVNGYPYKTIEDLGVANRQEAFTATKQAVYCYIHGNDLSQYEGMGQAGQRTLLAMKKIINDAQNSSETKLSNTITIVKNEDEWKQDNIDKNYLSKTYYITTNAQIDKYNITITKENAQNIGGIKLTNLENVEKQEFTSNERFKIMVPIKETKDEGSIKINVTANVKTKPVLYAMAPSTSYQDYAITAATYEDGVGETLDTYSKNDTKIIIIKQDEDNKQKLEGVEFELLDEEKNVAYMDLKTDKDGKIQIENIIPGKYYLREKNTIEGYIKYEDLIEIEVSLNEDVVVTVNNKKEEIPKIEKIKKQTNKEVKTLPVTGM